jgi:hypothetical protein
MIINSKVRIGSAKVEFYVSLYTETCWYEFWRNPPKKASFVEFLNDVLWDGSCHFLSDPFLDRDPRPDPDPDPDRGYKKLHIFFVPTTVLQFYEHANMCVKW